MRKKVQFFLFILSAFSGFSQENDSKISEIEIVYQKNTDIVSERAYKENLKNKYSDKEFIYTEEETKKEADSTPINPNFLAAISYFMSAIFPFLLGGVLIFIILKTVLGSEVGFWNLKKTKKIISKKLIYEDEVIHDVDLESLLGAAISDKNHRLAIRYYYLLILKDLSRKKIIKYDKDKTNSEYLLEIENSTTRKQFSYISYIYNYVWYGEFSVDEINFKSIENTYKSFLKTTI